MMRPLLPWAAPSGERITARWADCARVPVPKVREVRLSDPAALGVPPCLWHSWAA